MPMNEGVRRGAIFLVQNLYKGAADDSETIPYF